MPAVADCEILEVNEVAPEQFRMRLKAPEFAPEARPGQFCMVQVAEGFYPFLRRPMGVERIFPDGFSILFKVEGEGTRIMSRLLPGMTVSIQGPLGNGFPLDPCFKRHIVAAGGIGVAPCPALVESLKELCGKAPEVVLGARSKHLLLCTDDFREMGCEVHIATDDGSLGEKAFASDVLRRLKPGPGTAVYACGPMPMMAATAAVAHELGATCYVSLEAQMACGDGACLGCVVEAKVEHEGEKMVRVCADGPVFDAAIIDWEAHILAYDR